MNVPDVEIDCAALTEKDIEDAEFLLQLDPPIEYICVSFAQKGQDLQELIDIMDRMNIPQEKRPKICPKIEKPQALANIDGIIEKSQALMVARGDLGVEMEVERVPFAQKLLIAKAKKAGALEGDGGDDDGDGSGGGGGSDGNDGMQLWPAAG